MVGESTSPSAVSIRASFQTLNGLSDIRKTLRSLLGGDTMGSSLSFLSSAPPRDAPLSRPNPNRILCIWDVDDTLVSSGISGIRQSPVFQQSELVSLFRSLNGQARHLLLSQGSIDDVFSREANGQLQHLVPFFTQQEQKSCALRREEKAGVGCGALFACSTPKVKKKSRNVFDNPHKVEEEEAILVRIATLRAPPEEPNAAAEFLSAEKPPPRCPADVRWLVVRPSLWGISLSSLSNFIAPSPHTAFIDGSVFKKMDVVRSFAATGEWDAVFFLDNNVSELGVVRPGLGMEDYYRMKNVGKVTRFFLSELLLLNVSALLEEQESAVSKGTRSKSGVVHIRSSEPELNHSSTTNSLTDSKEASRDVSASADGTSPSSLRHVKRRFVQLVVAHLHLKGTAYRRITHAQPGTVGTTHREPTSFDKKLWQPIFTGEQGCTDEEYDQLIMDFRASEERVRHMAEKSLLSAMSVVDWEPRVDAVRFAWRPRPTRVSCLRHHYASVCHHIMTSIVEPLGRHPTEKEQFDLKKEANHLYRRIIRRQPVIDPVFISPICNTLFSILTSQSRLPRSVGETLKKDIEVLTNCSCASNRVKNGGATTLQREVE